MRLPYNVYMAERKPEPLYIDPRKVIGWLALALALFVAFILWAWPKYHRYLETERARTQVEVERILKGKQ